MFSACKHEKSVIRSFILNKNKKINFIKPNFINKNTQELPDSFYDAGQFYWADKKSWLNQNMYLLKGSLVEIDKKFVQDVDYINDLKILKKKFKKIKKNLMKKKILLTGAYGFLGTILSEKLEKNHYKVFKHGKKKSRDENFNLKDYKI